MFLLLLSQMLNFSFFNKLFSSILQVFSLGKLNSFDV